MSKTANQLEFNLEAIPYFLKSLLAGLSLLIYVPAAEKLTDLIQYCVSRLRFPDGTTITYSGKPATIKKALLPVSIVIWAQIILNSIFEDPWIHIGITIASAIATVFVMFPLLYLIASRLKTSNGSQLRFSGSLDELLKWQLIMTGCTVIPSLLTMILPESGFFGLLAGITLALLTLIALAVVLIPYSQWFGAQCTGGARTLVFQAEPIEVAGMCIGFILFSLFIVTIPWSVQWFVKWYASKYSLPARSAMAVAG
jgi:hypothetical protein